ncbi:hypothetical protein AX16_004606 [Volvariella volvacea WC 439]|nr:hypothetical protein AX16_004606 [Volvariella volvacea WC 439]
MDEQVEDKSTFSEASSSRLELTRDPYYYKHDGDCTLLVEGVLFKVHRCLLTRDSSMFETMFSLPQPTTDGLRHGSSDEDPVALQDSLTHFRALCWVLYALPNEIGMQHNAKRVNISRLILLATICGKYQFLTIERWALDLLSTHLTPRSTNKFLDSCSTESLSDILGLSILGDLLALQNNVKAKWIERVHKGQLSVSDALAVAERLNLRNFQGSLYYTQICRLAAQFSGSPENSQFDIHDKISELGLTAERERRLCRGFWSLTLLWSKLVDATSVIPTHSYYSGRQYEACHTRWESAFRKSLSLTHFSTDYLKNMDQMVNGINNEADCKSDFDRMCKTCQENGMIKMEEGKAKLEGCLSNHFLGVVN